MNSIWSNSKHIKLLFLSSHAAMTRHLNSKPASEVEASNCFYHPQVNIACSWSRLRKPITKIVKNEQISRYWNRWRKIYYLDKFMFKLQTRKLCTVIGRHYLEKALEFLLLLKSIIIGSRRNRLHVNKYCSYRGCDFSC